MQDSGLRRSKRREELLRLGDRNGQNQAHFIRLIIPSTLRLGTSIVTDFSPERYLCFNLTGLNILTIIYNRLIYN